MWLFFFMARASGEQPLGFDDALREAAEAAPAVLIAESTELARLGEIQVGYALFDNPDFAAERVSEDVELRLGLPIPIAGQPITRAVAAGAGRDAARLSAQAGRTGAVLDVGRAWLDARRALDLDELRQGTVELARQSREAARRLLETGEIGAVDAAVTEATAARAEVEASLARQEALRRAVLLEARLGRTPAGTLVPGDWPEILVPPGRDPATLPAVLAAEREADRAGANATLAKQDLVPIPTVTGGWVTEGDAPGPIYGVAVEVPIFAPGVGSVRQARGERDVALARALEARLGAEAECTAASRELEAAESAWAASQVGGLRAALDDLARAFVAGEYSLVDYVTRRDAVIAGLEAQIEARYRRAIANLRMWELAGELPLGEPP
jgi:outer membrane protein TolC